MTSRLLSDLGGYFSDFKPDLVLAVGDTSTVFASALAAYHQKIPFGHIEAGLRTNNLYSPWPEEGYRAMASTIAKYHFAPTELSKENLIRMGTHEKNIFVVGNTVIDALSIAVEKLESKDLKLDLPEEVLNLGDKKLVLITGHRRENFGVGIKNMCAAINELAAKYKDVLFVFPVHLNPNVKKQVQESLDCTQHQNILMTRPLSYLEFVWLMRRSYLIVTDSGGIQEEAPSLGKPVLVTRDTTERPEGVLAGVTRIVGKNKEKLVHEVTLLLTNDTEYNKMAQIQSPFGDGKAAERILSLCKTFIR
jgi:UDP-N-acetylglucosamine 2-epimerase (non-hydrolysing)